MRVLDGDTVEVLEPGNRLTRVRLAGIDAPEKSQPFGQRSRQALTALTADKSVHVSGSTQDRYGRLLGTIWSDTTDINAVQVKTGMALSVSRQGIGSGICRTGEAGTGEPVRSVGRTIPG